MTDQQIIEAVLKSCGWKYGKPHFSHDGKWHVNLSKDPFDWSEESEWAGKPPPVSECKLEIDSDGADILTSLDACHEVFEKDAPDEYWDTLHTVAFQALDKSSQMRALFPEGNGNFRVAIAKATPRQRCLAWLKFFGKFARLNDV